MIKMVFGLWLLVLISLTGFVVADGDGHGMMGGMMSGNYGYGMMFFGWLVGILVLVVLVLLAVWLFKQIQKK